MTDVRNPSLDLPPDERPSESPAWALVARDAWRQARTITASIAVLVVAWQVIQFGFWGVVALATAVWQDYIGGVAGWLLGGLLVWPLGLVGVHLHVPTLLRYYFAAGIVVSLSAYTAMSSWTEPGLKAEALTVRSWRFLRLAVEVAVGWLFRIAFWPFVLLVAVAGLFPSFGQRALDRTPVRYRGGVNRLPPPRHFIMIFTPLIYLIVLLVLYWLGTRRVGGLPPI